MNEWRKVHSPDVGWVVRSDAAGQPGSGDGVVAYCMSDEKLADMLLREHELAQKADELQGKLKAAQVRIAELEDDLAALR